MPLADEDTPRRDGCSEESSLLVVAQGFIELPSPYGERDDHELPSSRGWPALGPQVPPEAKPESEDEELEDEAPAATREISLAAPLRALMAPEEI